MATHSPELVVDTTTPEAEANPITPGSLQLWWLFHYYIFGTIFLCLACYASYSTIRSLSESTRSSRRVSSIGACILAIKLLLVTMGVTRALDLFLHRRYNDDLAWKITRNILRNVAYPCMTAGFGLMCQILYEASRLKTSSRSTLLASKVVLALVISIHFVTVITAVTLVVFLENFMLTLLVCHGFFVVWGIFLIVTFVMFSRRLLEAERESSQAMADIKFHENLSSAVSTGGTVSESSCPNDNCTIPSDRVVRLKTSDDQMKQQSLATGCDSPASRTGVHDDRETHLVPQKKSRGSEDETATKDERGLNEVPRVHGPVCTRRGFRIKLTRKVMRIANATTILAVVSVALNSLYVANSVASYYYGHKTTAAVLYVFSTLFRCVELGMGFTMAYFTTKSTKQVSGQNRGRANWPARLPTGAYGIGELEHKTTTDSTS